MSNHPFTSPNQPVDNIQVLLDYLQSEDNGEFLYRGQTYEHLTALLPSAYRGILNEKEVKNFIPTSEQKETSLRSLGHKFVGNFVSDWREFASSVEPIKRQTESQRSVIRQRLLNTFGYIFGTAFSQHYGFKSEALDASINPKVAAFFATYEPPNYDHLFQPQIKTKDGSESCGIIYRFKRYSQPKDIPSLMALTYYNAPGTLVLTDVLKALETEINLSQCWSNLRYYYELFRSSGERKLGLLQFPRGLVDKSRVGKQAASVIIPDEIHVYSDEPIYTAGPFGSLGITPGLRMRLSQSVEDLKTRDGVDAFYFRHSSKPPDIGFGPCDLWPNEADDLLATVWFVLSASFSSYVEQDENPNDFYKLIDPGVGTLNYTSFQDRIEGWEKCVNDFEQTLEYARYLDGEGERITYYVRKAARVFAKAHVTISEDDVRLAIKLCDQARKIDKESVVLALFSNILYDSLGDKRQAGYELNSAIAIIEAERRPNQKSSEGMNILQQILKELYIAQWSPNTFPDVLWEYYQSF